MNCISSARVTTVSEKSFSTWNDLVLAAKDSAPRVSFEKFMVFRGILV